MTLLLIFMLFINQFPIPIPPLPIDPPVVLYLPIVKAEQSPVVFEDSISCVGDLYNCDDFEAWNDAQLAFQFCMIKGLGDPHGLDRDADNFACENLPNPWK
jgi:hypothetical protein